jgi:hypothetical protein
VDSEFPMVDPIDVYPMHAMIAMSCPHNFGCNISHLGQMNAHWAAMHDAARGGGGYPFSHPGFRNWGIEREDIEFVPYWRNGDIVRRIGDGLICSVWKRPGSAVLSVMNHGPDPAGFETTRTCALTLDLASLGIPAEARGERLRVRELMANREINDHLTHFDWYAALPGEPDKYHPDRIHKYRPPIEPQLDPDTGALTGFDIFYHDQRYLVIHWEEDRIEDASWKDVLAGGAETVKVPGLINAEEGGYAVQAWRRPGSVMLLIENPTEEKNVGKIRLNTEALGIKVPPENLFREYTQIHMLAGDGGVRNCVWKATEEKTHYYTRGQLVYGPYEGLIVGLLQPGEKRLVCVDKY